VIGQEPHTYRVGLQIPLLGRTSSFVVCSDIAAIEEDHTQPYAQLLHQAQHALDSPDTLLSTAAVVRSVCCIYEIHPLVVFRVGL